MKNLILTMAIVTIVFSIKTYPQQQWGYTCSFIQSGNQTSFIGGNHKPERTDLYSGTNNTSVFPVLIVFVQYALGEPYPYDANWPAGSPPIDIDNYIASERNNNYGNDWWNAYSETNDRLSDFWMEASRGHFHVIGYAYSITLPLSASDYSNIYGNNATRKINDDIYHELEQIIPTYFWDFYDKWTKTENGFEYVPDGFIDMIYIVHRSWANVGGMPLGGIACLEPSYSQGINYLIPNTNLIIHGLSNAVSPLGSGLRMTPGSGGGSPNPPMDIKGVVSFSAHEHGHYLWGGNHAMYGKMSGYQADFGVDECLSPWESIKLGYMTPEVVNYFETQSYTIWDFSSRDNNAQGQVLQLPISGSDEFFLIANRQKVSSYDRIMWGDTCRRNPYFNLGTQDYYGKGIYIYHTTSGYNWAPAMDQECADGLWNWEYLGDQHPDWSDGQWVPYFKRTTPVFDKNDISNYEYHYNTYINNKDGKSCNRYWLEDGYNKTYMCWFNVGKKHQQLHTPGTESRI